MGGHGHQASSLHLEEAQRDQTWAMGAEPHQSHNDVMPAPKCAAGIPQASVSKVT